MISGRITGPQDLIEVLSTISINERGYLSILSKITFLVLNIENGRIKGFYTNYDISSSKNPLSLLIFVISEMLYEAEGYFSLEDSTAVENFIEIDGDVESVVIQVTILRKEIEGVIPYIISNFVFLYRNIYSNNGGYTFYLFLLNKLKNVLVGWNLTEELNALYKAIAHLPLLYVKEDSISLNRALTKKEERQRKDLFVEISDKAVERLSREEFEREMELELSPYKEVLKVLDIMEELYKEYEEEDNLS